MAGKRAGPPPSILAETDEYRRVDDSIQTFFKRMLHLGIKAMSARAQELFEAYADFCEETGFKPKGKKTFFQRMEKEFTKEKDRNGIYYKGLCLKELRKLSVKLCSVAGKVL